MNSSPIRDFSTISAQSSNFTLVYSQPLGSILTRGPISQNPWQPLFLTPITFSRFSVSAFSSTDTSTPAISRSLIISAYIFSEPPATQPVPPHIRTFFFCISKECLKVFLALLISTASFNLNIRFSLL